MRTITESFGSFWDNAAHYAVNIGLFYLHASVILPWALQKGRLYYWFLPLLVLGEVTAYIAVNYSLEHLLTNYLGIELIRPFKFDYHYCLRSTWRAVYLMGFGTGYYFLVTTLQERRRADQAEKEHLLHLIEKQQLQGELMRSQHAFLKAQINPHFLFNTLNFIYNSVRKTSTEAAETILSLSHMMRYALESGHEDQEVPLLEEVEQAENLIYLHQVRHNHRLHVQVQYDEALFGVKFIPLVLLTLVENVFKHGNLSLPENPARITLRYEAQTLLITTENLCLHQHQEGHRIGLNNIRRRLDYFYRERAWFEAWTDAKGLFHTRLAVTDGMLGKEATALGQQQAIVSTGY